MPFETITLERFERLLKRGFREALRRPDRIRESINAWLESYLGRSLKDKIVHRDRVSRVRRPACRTGPESAVTDPYEHDSERRGNRRRASAVAGSASAKLEMENRLQRRIYERDLSRRSSARLLTAVSGPNRGSQNQALRAGAARRRDNGLVQLHGSLPIDGRKVDPLRVPASGLLKRYGSTLSLRELASGKRAPSGRQGSDIELGRERQLAGLICLECGIRRIPKTPKRGGMPRVTCRNRRV